MNKTLMGLFLIFSLNSCSGQITESELVGTQWEYAFSDDNKDYLKFFDNGKYESYSAEAMMTSIGVYFIKNDTLNLVSVIDVNNDHRFKPRHIKAKIVGGKLSYLSFDRIYKNEWQKSDFIFDPEYVLIKVN